MLHFPSMNIYGIFTQIFNTYMVWLSLPKLLKLILNPQIKKHCPNLIFPVILVVTFLSSQQSWAMCVCEPETGQKEGNGCLHVSVTKMNEGSLTGPCWPSNASPPAVAPAWLLGDNSRLRATHNKRRSYYLLAIFPSVTFPVYKFLSIQFPCGNFHPWVMITCYRTEVLIKCDEALLMIWWWLYCVIVMKPRGTRLII